MGSRIPAIISILRRRKVMVVAIGVQGSASFRSKNLGISQTAYDAGCSPSKLREPRCRSSTIDSTLARAPFAGRWIDPAARLLRLSDSRVPGAVACGAPDFYRQLGGFQLAHGHHFLDTMPTASMSLCITDCGPRLSHFKVKPDQFDSVTVAWSFLSSRQQTREPTPNSLDSEPVIRLTAFVRVGPAR